MLPKIAFSIMATTALAVWAAGPAFAGADPLSGGTAPTPRAGHHLAGPHLLRPRSLGGQSAAVITGPLINHGGPVQNAPRVYVVYWGWTSDPSGEQPYLNNFLSSAGGTPWLSTVSQYGGGSTGSFLAGTWSDPSPIPASPSDAQVQAEALAAVSHFGTGNSVNVDVVVATPTGHSSPGFNTQFCAYHGPLAADPSVAYTDLPYMPDAGSNCGARSVNGPDGTLDGVSIVAGHELAEAITDPLVNAQTAWADALGNEIADKCSWTSLDDITTSTGIYAVQPLWTNAANGCAPGSTPVAGPSCETGGSQITCSTSAPGAPSTLTWTIFSQSLIEDPFSRIGSHVLGIRCQVGGVYRFANSWISGGVNYFSNQIGIPCRGGPQP